MIKIFNKDKLDYFDNFTSFLPRETVRIVKSRILKKFSDKVKNTSQYNFRQHTCHFFTKNRKSRIFKTKNFQYIKITHYQIIRLQLIILRLQKN